MKAPSRKASRAHRIVCPFCESGALVSSGPGFARCDSCGLPLLGSTLETLRDMIGLPDALGAHPCECGHPEMRRLPDGIFHCPACGSEVLPAEVSGAPTGARWSATSRPLRNPVAFGTETTRLRLARPDRVSDRAWRKPSTERDLHPTLHQKVEGSSTATTYNYTRATRVTETASKKGWRKYDRND